MKKIVVVCKGDSKEKEVSLKSGKTVYEALLKNFQNVECLECSDKKSCIQEIATKNPDLVFIALHGSWGENGYLQAALDMLNIEYTGSNCESSALCMNKFVTKSILKNINIPTPKGILINNCKDIDDIDFYPVCIKPNSEGSSIGVYFANNKEELFERVKELLKEFKDILIEEKIEGKELTVSVINGKALPIIEIRPKKGFYDYKNKYTAGSTEYIVPAPLGEDITRLCQKLAIRTYQALGCSSAARVDMLIRDNVPYVLEVNTIPGMTATSLLPKAAKSDGISFEDLVKIMALEK